MEETGVEGLEDLVEIVVMASWSGEAFAAAGLADVLGLLRDGIGGYVAAIAVGVDAGDGLLVELGEEDVGDGVVDGVGGRLEQVGEADVQAAFAQADGGVERGEAAEADVEWRNGRTRSQVAVLLFEDGDERGRWSGLCYAFFRGGRSTSSRRRRCGELVEQSRWRRGRGKELQELTQGRGAGMFRCGQVLVLNDFLDCGVSFRIRNDFIRLCPAGRAHCAWSGHFVACIPVVAG